MRDNYVYFLIGINTVRLSKKIFDSKKMSVYDLEVLMWSDSFQIYFETNELSISIAESEEILKMEPILKLEDAIDKSVQEYIECVKNDKKQFIKNKISNIYGRTFDMPLTPLDITDVAFLNMAKSKKLKRAKLAFNYTIKEEKNYSLNIDDNDLKLYKI